MTSSCGARTGSFLSSNWSMRVKIAVFAPIPSASERMATDAKSGLRRRLRKASRRSEVEVLMLNFDGVRRAKVGTGGGAPLLFGTGTSGCWGCDRRNRSQLNGLHSSWHGWRQRDRGADVAALAAEHPLSAQRVLDMV